MRQLEKFSNICHTHYSCSPLENSGEFFGLHTKMRPNPWGFMERIVTNWGARERPHQLLSSSQIYFGMLSIHHFFVKTLIPVFLIKTWLLQTKFRLISSLDKRFFLIFCSKQFNAMINLFCTLRFFLILAKHEVMQNIIYNSYYSWEGSFVILQSHHGKAYNFPDKVLAKKNSQQSSLF